MHQKRPKHDIMHQKFNFYTIPWSKYFQLSQAYMSTSEIHHKIIDYMARNLKSLDKLEDYSRSIKIFRSLFCFIFGYVVVFAALIALEETAGPTELWISRYRS